MIRLMKIDLMGAALSIVNFFHGREREKSRYE